MKMLYVGSLTKGPDRDSSWIDAFQKLGCEVITFSSNVNYESVGIVGKFFNKIRKRFSVGYKNKNMQVELLRVIELEKPRWVHFVMPIGINRSTIQFLVDKKIVVTEYFNDDPFSKSAPFGIYWKFLDALSLYDGHFVWRPHNVTDFKNAGAKHVEHSPPYYDPAKVLHTIDPTHPPEIFCDAAFIGHWENDWRVDCLDALCKSGASIVLKGGGWNRAIKNTSLEKYAPINHAFDAEYVKIYRGALAGICFFSKINRDSWTRRALEIVAVGGVLVCERTEEALGYFTDREDACFFSTVDELVSIVNFLRSNPLKRIKIRDSGFKKLVSGDHTIANRAVKIYQHAITIQKSYDE